jgi:DNA-binding NarL/FixJ family response regulator
MVHLTERQRKFLCLAAKGMQNAKIAQEPEAATKNMAHHMTEIKKALNHSLIFLISQ